MISLGSVRELARDLSNTMELGVRPKIREGVVRSGEPPRTGVLVSVALSGLLPFLRGMTQPRWQPPRKHDRLEQGTSQRRRLLEPSGIQPTWPDAAATVGAPERLGVEFKPTLLCLLRPSQNTLWASREDRFVTPVHRRRGQRTGEHRCLYDQFTLLLRAADVPR